MKKISFLKNIVLACFACFSVMQHASAQLTVAANTHVVSSGSNTQIVLQNVGLVNNGTMNHSSGNIKFNGTAISGISGNGSLSLYNLEVNKTANSVLLSRNIAVKNQLKFTSGILNLNGFDVDLLSTGTLINETEVNRIIGPNGGKVKTTVLLNAPSGANPGNLGAVLTSTEDFGSVSIQRGHQSQLNDQGTGTSVLRYYDIIPTNNTALKATLRLNYFDAELNSIPEADLVLFKGSAAGSWEEKGYTSRDAVTNYVEKINIPNFSRWTLSNAGNVLASGCPGGVPAENYYADLDGDGYGDPNSVSTACTQPAGYVTNKTDCNDDPLNGGAAIHPGATEVCNGIDDDCDGQIDEGVQTTYYADADSDGYGNTAISVKACVQPAGYVATGGDCNDNNPTVNPAASEICGNLVDDNCNGQVDEGCNTATPVLTINDITVIESQGTAQITVALSAPSAATVKVKYKTLNGTAVHPKDYQRTTGELVFAPGTTSQIISIPVVADNRSEGNEYFDVELNTAQGATISDGTGRITITENKTAISDGSRTKTEAKSEPINTEALKPGTYFNVLVWSNPTNSQFSLRVESSAGEKITIQVSDARGRVIDRVESLYSSQTIYLGGHYRPGIYFAKVMQGNNSKTVKLVKL